MIFRSPAGGLKPVREPAERMWQCAGYARELCTLARTGDAAAREAALDAHIARFAPVIRIDAAMVRELMTRSIEVAGNYTAAAGFAVSKTAMLMGMSALCGIDQRADAASRVSSPTADEKTVLVARTPPAGWRARIAQALRAVF